MRELADIVVLSTICFVPPKASDVLFGSPTTLVGIEASVVVCKLTVGFGQVAQASQPVEASPLLGRSRWRRKIRLRVLMRIQTVVPMPAICSTPLRTGNLFTDFLTIFAQV